MVNHLVVESNALPHSLRSPIVALKAGSMAFYSVFSAPVRAALSCAARATREQPQSPLQDPPSPSEALLQALHRILDHLNPFQFFLSCLFTPGRPKHETYLNKKLALFLCFILPSSINHKLQLQLSERDFSRSRAKLSKFTTQFWFLIRHTILFFISL